MALLQLVLLLVFLSECYGETHFIYLTQDAVKLQCETGQWQISTESNNRINLNCSLPCKSGEDYALLEDQKNPPVCDKDKDSQSRNAFCSLKVEKRSGYFACVRSLDHERFLYPFKSSPTNIIKSYIIAVPNPELTDSPERGSSSSLNVPEGGSVTLNCTLNFTEKYKNQKFDVYWIKTVGQISTCIYYYDYDLSNSQTPIICDEQTKRGSRLTNTEDQCSHNIKISGVKMSDAGQYQCALQMDTSFKNGKSVVNWKVIENFTLSVHKPSIFHSTDQSPDTSAIQTGVPLVVVYVVVVAVLLCVLLVGVFVFIRKRRIPVAGPWTGQQERKKEEDPDGDCSPYAVGRGDQEYKSKNSFSSTADQGHGESSEPVNPYSVIRLNDLYDSTA